MLYWTSKCYAMKDNDFIPFVWHILNRWVQRQNRSAAVENGKELLSKYGILFRNDENLLKLDRNDGCIILWALNTTQLFTSFFKKDLFIWLQQALVVACRIFNFLCSMCFLGETWDSKVAVWDIFPQSG